MIDELDMIRFNNINKTNSVLENHKSEVKEIEEEENYNE